MAWGVAQEAHVGMYALLGAAAFMGGLLRMSASMCLILMEMTAAPNQLPFLMLVLIISKGVGDRCEGRGDGRRGRRGGGGRARTACCRRWCRGWVTGR